jgi:hypothetical protein
MAFDFAQTERRLVRIPKSPFSLSAVEGHAPTRHRTHGLGVVATPLYEAGQKGKRI